LNSLRDDQAVKLAELHDRLMRSKPHGPASAPRKMPPGRPGRR